MIWYKSCPRCTSGDLTLDEDGDKLCLQCVYIEVSVRQHTLTSRVLISRGIGADGARSRTGGASRRRAVVAV